MPALSNLLSLRPKTAAEVLCIKRHINEEGLLKAPFKLSYSVNMTETTLL